MIKLIKATYVKDFVIDLYFSNGKEGRYDFSELISRSGTLVKPLRDATFFKQFFLELGALCWKNGLELSALSLYKNLEALHALKDSNRAA